MEIINLTPHMVKVFGTAGDWIHLELPRCEEAPRAESTEKEIGRSPEGIPVVEMSFGKVELPEAEEGKYLLVSRTVAEAAAANGRVTWDLFMTADPVRDADGRIIGCRKFARLPQGETAGICDQCGFPDTLIVEGRAGDNICQHCKAEDDEEEAEGRP